jgi:hypothetical protein
MTKRTNMGDSGKPTQAKPRHSVNPSLLETLEQLLYTHFRRSTMMQKQSSVPDQLFFYRRSHQTISLCTMWFPSTGSQPVSPLLLPVAWQHNKGSTYNLLGGAADVVGHWYPAASLNL